jgi:hypothetical protein
MKHFQVVKEYFSLLFKSEVNKKELLNVPLRYHKMVDTQDFVDDLLGGSSDEFLSSSSSDGEEDCDEDFDEDYGGEIEDLWEQGLSEWGEESTTHGSVWHDHDNGNEQTSHRSRSRAGSRSAFSEIELGYSMYGNHGREGNQRSPTNAEREETRSVTSRTSKASKASKASRTNNNKSLKRTTSRYSPHKPPPPVNPIIHGHRRPALNFTEFLRTNMRLAEDRVLSFVSVFSTRYGTKWIPGATFYYTPEIRWQSLLLQRRRWINGTFASFLFFLLSKRAETRLNARMFDDHSLSKGLVQFLWKLQLFQMLLVFVSPAIFGSTGYISVLDIADRFPSIWGWGKASLLPTSFIVKSESVNFVGADLWIFVFFIIYATWSFAAHFITGGRMPELACHIVALLGVVFMIPIYWSLHSKIVTE